MKKITLITIILMLLGTTNVVAMNTNDGKITNIADVNVQENSIITPQWTTITQITNSLNFENGKAVCKVSVEVPKTKVDTVSFSISLQRQEGTKWVTVNSWSESKSVVANDAIFSKASSIERGFNYRFTGSITCYLKGTYVEATSVSSIVQKY